MSRRARGQQEYLALIGTPAEETLGDVREISPAMYYALIEGAFGGTLAGAELERASRELATIAILAAAGGAERQLATHLEAALRAGVAPSELVALCEHVSVYAGF